MTAGTLERPPRPLALPLPPERPPGARVAWRQPALDVGDGGPLEVEVHR